MNLKKIILISVFCFSCSSLFSQKVSGVYKINDLLNRLKNTDTTYIVNFWATWCKPCVKELPAFDSITALKKVRTKVLLICLDFKENIEKKVNPFLKKNNIKNTVILLDEINGNDYINKIAQEWTGAIPATYYKNKQKELFMEGSTTVKEIEEYLLELKKK
ncbi:MAG: redoxin domain-containing protein [Bacteroidetes bacterium]|nr:redoxin domain-containing protein [Bacteroidota bacterium]